MRAPRREERSRLSIRCSQLLCVQGALACTGAGDSCPFQRGSFLERSTAASCLTKVKRPCGHQSGLHQDARLSLGLLVPVCSSSPQGLQAFFLEADAWSSQIILPTPENLRQVSPGVPCSKPCQKRFELCDKMLLTATMCHRHRGCCNSYHPG